MNNNQKVITKLLDLKDWLYIKDGSYSSHHEWKEGLIKRINNIITIVSQEEAEDEVQET